MRGAELGDRETPTSLIPLPPLRLPRPASPAELRGGATLELCGGEGRCILGVKKGSQMVLGAAAVETESHPGNAWSWWVSHLQPLISHVMR